MASWRRFSVTCIQCGSVVQRSNPSITCGLKCRSAFRIAKRIAMSPVAACPVCGIVGALHRKAHDTLVCSARCRSVSWARRDRRVAGRPPTTVPLGTIRLCMGCAGPFVVKRFDSRFCCIICQDRWSYRYGQNGKAVRVKQQKAREDFNRTVGACALCQTSYNRLRPASVFGMRRRNGVAIFHVDHVVPTSRGGANIPSNRRHLCWFCNSARMDMDAVHDSAIAAAGRAFWAAT